MNPSVPPRQSVLFAVALCVACSTTPTTPTGLAQPSAAITLASNVLWDGGTITLHSPDFKLWGDSAHLTVDGTAVATTRVNDSTIQGVLQSGLSGTYAVNLMLGANHMTVPAITVYGFAEVALYSVNAIRHVIAKKIGDVALVAALTPSGLSVIDLNTHGVTAVGAPLGDGLLSPGSSYQDTVLFLGRTTTGVEGWTFAPSPQPLAVSATGVSVFHSYAGAQLGPNTWIFAGNSGATSTFTRSDSSHAFGLILDSPFHTSSATEFRISPRHDRAAVLGYEVDGLPVLGIATGGIAYMLSQFVETDGADFTPDGASFVAAGISSAAGLPNGRVLLLRASDGHVLADTTLGFETGGLAVDATRGVVYIASDNATTGHWSISVLDLQALHPVGVLMAPAAIGNPGFGPQGSRLVMDAQNNLYLVTDNGNAALRFSLPPVGEH